MPRPYREYRFFSLDLDGDAVRLSMTDDQGSEYYAIVPSSEGKAWRERREKTLDMIEDAIDRGMAPGEVLGGQSPGASGGAVLHSTLDGLGVRLAPARERSVTPVIGRPAAFINEGN